MWRKSTKGDMESADSCAGQLPTTHATSEFSILISGKCCAVLLI